MKVRSNMQIKLWLVVMITLVVAPGNTAAESLDELDWVAIPLMKFSDEAGFVYGVKGEVVDFSGDTSPFAWNVEAQFVHSTTNRHEHRLVLDVPDTLDTPWRFTARAEFLHIDDAKFFGVGNRSINTGNEDFHQFSLTEPRLKFFARRPVFGSVHAGGGLTANVTFVRASADSALSRDNPLGRSGGVGLAPLLLVGYDSRDQELMPTKGYLAEAYAKGTSTSLGSDFNFITVGLTQQLYISPFPWLVLAQRLMIEHIGGNAPFYELQRIGGSRDFFALGGVYSQRGFLEGRFAGPTKVLSNSEARIYFPPLWDKLRLGVGGFADVSRVLDDKRLDQDLHTSGGGSLFIGWGRIFLLRTEYGISNEEQLLYIEGRHMF